MGCGTRRTLRPDRKPADGHAAIDGLEAELDDAVADLDNVLTGAADPCEVRIDDNDELVVPRLPPAESVPDGVDELRDRIAELMPVLTLGSMLVELHARVGVLDHFEHAGGVVTRPADLERNLIYVIVAEATNVLGNTTDLPIEEHATDTHGATLANFALFDLVGLRLTPRIRDVGNITLCRTRPKRDLIEQWPNAGPLFTRRANTTLTAQQRDELLRSGALREYGTIRRTIFAARHLADEAKRRRTHRQLNKGENLHGLRRAIAYAASNGLRSTDHVSHTDQMGCLDPAHQRHRRLDHRVLQPLRRAPTSRGPRDQHRSPRPNLAHTPRQHQQPGSRVSLPR